MKRDAVVVAPDLLFQSRIEAALEQRGFRVIVPATAEDASAAVTAGQLLVVDLQATGFDAVALIREAHAGGAKVLAFGRHTDATALRSARDAGADLAVPRSQLAEELPRLLDDLLAGMGQGTSRLP